MKVASFKGDSANLMIFKPVVGLFVRYALASAKVRVQLINSKTGSVKEIIPSTMLRTLFEYSTFGEGAFEQKTAASGPPFLSGFLSLARENAVSLSNDCYLSVDITGNGSSSNTLDTVVYGVETNLPVASVVSKYDPLYIASGDLRKTFAVNGQSKLVLQMVDGMEVQLITKNGQSPIYSYEELRLMTQSVNDILYVLVPTTGDETAVYGHEALTTVLDLTDVEMFEIRFTTNSGGYNVILVGETSIDLL